MFSDEQKREWQSVKCPEKVFDNVKCELENKKCNSGKNSHKGFKRIAFPLIAASLVFVFAAVVFFGKAEDVSIIYDGSVISSQEVSFELPANLANYARTVVLSDSIELDIDVNKETMIKTDCGYFEVLDGRKTVVSRHTELLCQEDTTIRWHYPISEDVSVAELTLLSGTSEYELVLTHSKADNTRALICTRK